MAGLIFVNGLVSDKPGTSIDKDAEIVMREDPCPYVGRGGLKLKKAVDVFGVRLSGCAAMDIGASTGGFTDCMLQEGALRVYAVDVGYGQLDYKLRTDPRVVNHERVNIRHLDESKIPEKADLISIDVSFISVRLVFPKAVSLLKESGDIICLVKPQFEAGREQVGKNGIVRAKHIHEEVIANVISYGKDNGLYSAGLTFSPLTGAKGNIEYLLHLKKTSVKEAKSPDTSGTGGGEAFQDMMPVDIGGVVEEAHAALSRL